MTNEQLDNVRMFAVVYGKKPQLQILMEECAELIQAASKVLRNEYVPEHIDHLVEEIADVLIMAEQITYLYDFYDVVDRQIEAKIQRQLQRIEESRDGAGAQERGLGF